MDRVHFCSIDTESMNLAISGSTIEGHKQQFKYAIKDQQFKTIITNNGFLKKGVQLLKKETTWLRYRIIERKYHLSSSQMQFCYRQQKNDDVEDVIRMKVVNEKNSGLIRDGYINCIENYSNESVQVTQIQLKNGVMSMIKINKSELTGVIDKMIVIDNDISKGQSFSCAPQIMNIDASNYRYKDNVQWSKDYE
ncbi:MAG: hypothetical protein EZS28_029454 [Streblomastix strix]|uniref:Uncharacterized protein n=1 Tax=Streblomastix strix TaxID=222440 RepID=A0A5J4UX18_9EUKA|nr:MAG: hypothetical protein EZS28_029454 [Streblomastix strix]